MLKLSTQKNNSRDGSANSQLRHWEDSNVNEELGNLVETSGQTLHPINDPTGNPDLNKKQLSEAVARYGAGLAYTYQDTSTTDNLFTLIALGQSVTPQEPQNGVVVIFDAHAANTGATQIKAGGWPAKDLKLFDGTALLANSITQNMKVWAQYNGSFFVLPDWSNALKLGGDGGDEVGIPTGGFILWGGSAPPAKTLECDGAAISRTVYANLFNIIGTTYGVGDGVATFNLPDLINKYIKGAASGAVGQSAVEKGQFEIQLAANPGTNLSIATVSTVVDQSGVYGAAARHYGATRGSTSPFYTGFEVSGKINEKFEPKSFAPMICIKY